MMENRWIMRIGTFFNFEYFFHFTKIKNKCFHHIVNDSIRLNNLLRAFDFQNNKYPKFCSLVLAMTPSSLGICGLELYETSKQEKTLATSEVELSTYGASLALATSRLKECYKPSEKYKMNSLILDQRIATTQVVWMLGNHQARSNQEIRKWRNFNLVTQYSFHTAALHSF